MPSDLDRYLEEAFAARAQIDDLQAKADELPDLLKQKAIEDHEALVKFSLENEIHRATKRFALLAERAPLLKARFERLITDILELCSDLKTFHADIINTGLPLKTAQGDFDEVFKPTPKYTDAPEAFTQQASLDDALLRVGGDNPDLMISRDDLPKWMIALLHSQGVTFYRPERLGGNWFSRR